MALSSHARLPNSTGHRATAGLRPAIRGHGQAMGLTRAAVPLRRATTEVAMAGATPRRGPSLLGYLHQHSNTLRTSVASAIALEGWTPIRKNEGVYTPSNRYRTFPIRLLGRNQLIEMGKSGAVTGGSPYRQVRVDFEGIRKLYKREGR